MGKGTLPNFSATINVADKMFTSFTETIDLA